MNTSLENQSPGHKVSAKTRFSIVAVAFVAFLGILAETSLNVTFPTLEKTFGLPLGTVQWVTTAYLLVVALVMPTSSYISQRFQDRTLFFSALAFFTIGDLLSLISPNFTILMMGRLIQGIGTGIAIPLMFNLVLTKIPRERVGVWMGFAGMILSIAPALGPTYGGLLTGTIGWRMIFALILIIPVFVFPLGAWAIEQAPKKSSNKFDFVAFSFLSIAMTSALLALDALTNPKMAAIWFIIFALSLAAFIWRCKTSDLQFLDIEIFKSPTFTLSVLVYCLLQFANLGINFIIPNFLQISLGTSSTLAGFALLPGSLIGSASQGPIGALYDRKGAKGILLSGNVIFFVALVLLTIFTKNLTLVSLMALYILFTIGRSAGFATTMTNSLAQLSPQKAAAGNAWFTTGSQFAASAGTATASLIATKADNLTTGTQHVFILFLGITVVNFIFYSLILNKKIN
ncbi:MFS transporter [Lactococcus kimchii]|uniref:MFS transporter n=1 Tax=Lactococcus sp. S-13 TaxID=2507158 RepID=UPI0010235150|nr:MFS transporter [Lactococcus sp. S-13]RZI48836.1 MFS transporter [Lactococcus sp. S-13]